jgi:integrase
VDGEEVRMSYRYEKRLPGIGPIRKMTGLSTRDDFDEFSGLMLTLARTKPRLCEMFRDGEITATELLLANRNTDLSRLMPDARVLMALWGQNGAFERAFQGHKQGATVTRYRVSARKFHLLSPGLHMVRDLETVDYEALAKAWPGSPSDWMAFYRMLSHFLTRHFGGKRTGRSHPFRAQVMDLLPRKAEKKRVPAISPAVFHRLVSLTPVYAQPVYRALLITGFRWGEYEALDRGHLRPQTFEIEVPGTKTVNSADVVPVDPACWAEIERAVPSPIAYGQIRKHWAKACLAEGLATKVPDPCRPGRLRYKGPTLHDIRHLTGQFMTNAGVPESMVQAYLRHSDPSTTRRYTMQAMRAEASSAIARAVGA